MVKACEQGYVHCFIMPNESCSPAAACHKMFTNKYEQEMSMVLTIYNVLLGLPLLLTNASI